VVDPHFSGLGGDGAADALGTRAVAATAAIAAARKNFTVGNQLPAIDVARVVRGEEQRDRRDLFRRPISRRGITDSDSAFWTVNTVPRAFSEKAASNCSSVISPNRPARRSRSGRSA
jgi:hypothetical protein